MEEDIKKKLEEFERRIAQLEQIPDKTNNSIPIETVGSKSDIARLAAKSKVSEAKIREIFDIEADSLTVVKISGGDIINKTKDITLLVLLGYKYLFGKEDIFAQEIKRNVGENGAPLDNFATYLNNIIPSLVRRKGKVGSHNTTYRLTVLGEAKAKELLKILINS